MTDAVTAEPFDVGVVAVTLDTELGWGAIDSADYDGLERRLDRGKDAIRRLLALFEEHEVPATWDLVGQLFRKGASGAPPSADAVAPPEADVPWERDWWHAPEVITEIVDSPVDHELASHSGSHLVYDEASVAAVEADLDLFRSVSEGHGPIESFVFPQNRVGHLDALREAGFTCFRGRPPVLGSDPSPTVFSPRRVDGLIDVPASTALRHYGGRPLPLRLVPDRLKGVLLRAGVRRAARSGRVFHVVLHPVDFALPSDDGLLSALVSFLTTTSEARAAGKVRTATMAEIADEARFPDGNGTSPVVTDGSGIIDGSGVIDGARNQGSERR